MVAIHVIFNKRLLEIAGAPVEGGIRTPLPGLPVWSFVARLAQNGWWG